MKRFAMTSLAVIALAAVAAPGASPPDSPKGQAWLAQFVGEWTSNFSLTVEPGKALACEGTESIRSLGGKWTVADSKVDFMGQPITGLMTLGYDSTKGKYVGTRIDSMSSSLLIYEGTLDEAGKILTLEANGPNPLDPSKSVAYRDTIEFKGEDHKVYKSSIQGPDGEWSTIVTVDYRRQK